MVHKERWEEVRRRYFQERKAIAEIARGLDMDRKTVRRCVREEQWQPYQRVRGGPMLLSGHEEYLRQRPEEVGYSAQILYQALRARGLSRQLRDGEAICAAAAHAGEFG